MVRLLFVRALDTAIDVLVLIRALFAIAAAVTWRLTFLPSGRPNFRNRLLLVAVAIAAAVALFCAANAHGHPTGPGRPGSPPRRPEIYRTNYGGGNIVDVTQSQQKQVCTLGGCRIERIPQKDIGVIVGQIADGSWIALGHARKFQVGQAQIDLGDGSGPVRATVFAKNSRLDLSLLKFDYDGWLPCRPLDHDQEARNWIVTQLGTLPVAPAGQKQVKPSSKTADPTTFAQGSTAAVEEIPPPRDPAPTHQPSAPAAVSGGSSSEMIDWHSLIRQAAQEGAKAAGAELKKLQIEHTQQLRNDYAQAVAAQNTSGARGMAAAKQAAAGVVKSDGPAIFREALKDAIPVIVRAAKTAAPSALSIIGYGALGATGPVGIGLAVGGLLLRSLKKLHQKNHNELLGRLNRRPPQQGPTSALPESQPENLSPPSKAPPAVASAQETAPAADASIPPPDQTRVATTFVKPGSIDTGVQAWAAAKKEYINRHPGQAAAGAIRELDALWNQAVAGLPSPPV